MDRFLSQLDYGQTQMLYHAFTVFSIAAAVAFNVSYGRAFGITHLIYGYGEHLCSVLHTDIRVAKGR